MISENAHLFQNHYRIKSARLTNWDYGSNGYYFVTICTRNRKNFFGQIQNDRMVLSDMGKIAAQYWREIPKHFENVKLDECVVMPNHIHGIIIIDNDTYRDKAASTPKSVETCHGYNENTCRDEAMPRLYDTNNQKTYRGHFPDMSKISPQPGSLSVIIGAFKSIVTKKTNLLLLGENFSWQPRFHDHIIRNENELNVIREYIRNNPLQWTLDREDCLNPTKLFQSYQRTIAEQKKILRQQMLQRLRNLSVETRHDESLRLIQKLQRLPAFQNARNILLYVSQEYEVGTHTLIQACLKAKNVFLPKTNLKKKELGIYPLKKWTDLQVGAFGILEPPRTKKISLNKIDLAVIPGIAFTKDGKRLGHGLGLYDKLLAKNKKVVTVGLAYREQVLKNIPVTYKDQMLQIILVA